MPQRLESDIHLLVRGTSCGTDDVYRLRAYETTSTIARFNNSATQVTVVMAQNAAAQPVSVRVAFWTTAGSLLHEQEFSLPARGSFVLNTSAVPALAGQGGSVTIQHDGPYATLTGKAVALEPATGFAFDSTLDPKPR